MKNFCSLFILSIFLFGCQKEVSFERPDDVLPGTTSSITEPLLKSYKLVEGTDTIGRYEYTYDNTGRLTSTHGRRYTSGVLETEYNYYPVYNNTTDSLPKLISYYIEDIYNGTDSIKEYFSYSSNWKMTRDSNVQNALSPLVYYFNNLSAFLEVTSNFGDLQHTYQTYSGVNLLNEKDSIWLMNSVNSVALFSASFDTHVNPFFKINVKRPAAILAEHVASDFGLFAQKNNPLEETRSFPANPFADFHNLYNYTYRPDGYPISVIITETINGTLQKGFYTYY